MSATNPQLRHAGDTDDVLAQSRMHALDHGHSLFQDLIATDASIPPAIARLSLGLVMLPHALQKAFGWFGGAGFSGTYHLFTTGIGLPGAIAFLAICAEIFGALSLILGFLTRNPFYTASIAVAVFSAVSRVGFF